MWWRKYITLIVYSKNHLLSSLKDTPFYDSRKFPKYSNNDILSQIIIRNLLGHFNQADQLALIDAPLLLKYINACSQPTLSRFFDRVTIKTNMYLKELVQKLGCDYVNTNVQDIILDVDSTKDITNGHQEGASYIFYYGINGYHSMTINEYNTKLLLSSNFRTGSAYSSNGFLNELKEVLSHLDRKGKTISFRGGSAFYNAEFLDYMNNEKIKYYVWAKNYTKVHDLVLQKLEEEGIDYTNYTSNKPYYGEITYKLTNMEKTCGEIYDFYEERGNSENFTKELKDDFNGKNVGHHEFEKNCMQFMISSLCYNMYHLFRLMILEGKDQLIRMNTYRSRYQKIAVKVVKHARRITLSFSSA